MGGEQALGALKGRIAANADTVIGMGSETWSEAVATAKARSVEQILEPLSKSFKDGTLKRSDNREQKRYQLLQKYTQVRANSGISHVVDSFSTLEEAIEACEWNNYQAGDDLIYFTVRDTINPYV